MQSSLEISHEGRIARFVVQAATENVQDSLEAVRASSDAAVVVLEIGAIAGTAGSFDWIERFELPVICAFETAMQGAAAEFALACDIRICGEDASITPPTASAARLRRLLRDPRALDRAVRGETFTSREALDCGLVSKVTAAGEAMRMAAVMATRGPIALRLGKEAIWRGLAMPLEQGLRFETDLTLLLQTTKDRAEGVRAFMEKREPRFTGD